MGIRLLRIKQAAERIIYSILGFLFPEEFDQDWFTWLEFLQFADILNHLPQEEQSAGLDQLVLLFRRVAPEDQEMFLSIGRRVLASRKNSPNTPNNERHE
jgi:hypothetical protein